MPAFWELGLQKLVYTYIQLKYSFLNGPLSASFIIYFRSFQTNITFYNNICENIQYPAPGFELTNSWTGVSSYNQLSILCSVS